MVQARMFPNGLFIKMARTCNVQVRMSLALYRKKLTSQKCAFIFSTSECGQQKIISPSLCNELLLKWRKK